MIKFLIAGGSGMIGSKLVKKLKQNNIEFVFLSTQNKTNGLKNSFHWNPELDIFPELDLKTFDAVINFCGAGIFDQTIDDKRKKILYDSRIKPIEALNKAFERQNIKAPIFVSASATGYYDNISSEIINENSPKGQGFLADLVEAWEKTIFSSHHISDNICAIRIGIVLSDTGGFLRPISKSIKYYAGSAVGSGKQMVSWIHVDDLCNMILFAINKKLQGAFNASSPNPESMESITKMSAKLLHKPLFLPNVPPFALRLLFGNERHKLLLTDQKIMPTKMIENGFEFKYPVLKDALENLLK